MYNYFELPAQIEISGGPIINDAYNNETQRLDKKVDGSAVTKYIYGMDGQVCTEQCRRVMAEYDGAGTLQMWRLGGFGHKVKSGGFNTESYYYNLPRLPLSGVKDHPSTKLRTGIGNIRVTIDDNAAIVTKDDYYPFGWRDYYPELGRWTVLDPARQFVVAKPCHRQAGGKPLGASGYVFNGNTAVNGFDEDGRWFGIDDLIVSGVSFVVGYVSHGMSTGDWGSDAVATGGIAAGSAWLAYTTGGAAAGFLGFAEGSTGFAIASATIGGAVGGATGSIGNQAYFTGQVDWNTVGNSALFGGAGGFAGGFAGQYLTSNPILSSMIGGGVSGGLEGGQNGNWVQGVIRGSFSGAISGALTVRAYEMYGEYLTNKMLGEGAYDSDYEGTPVGVKNKIADFKQQGTNIEFVEDMYDCLAFAKDYHDIIGDGVPVSFNDAKHFGVRLGRTKYGQSMILSKVGSP